MAFNLMMDNVYNMNMYIEGFNYVNMYTTIVNNIILNNIPIDYFGFTPYQVNTLYNVLYPIIGVNNLYNQNVINQI